MHTIPAAKVVTRADLVALGWSDSAIARAVRSRRLIRLRPGVYATCEPDPVMQAVAVVRAIPGTVISHTSALMTHRLPFVGARGFAPTVTVAPTGRGTIRHAHLHRAQLRPEDVVVVDGVPVTSIARTLVDVARHRSTICAVAAIDAALHDRRVTPEQLQDVLRFCANWPRISRAGRAVQLADARAESPLESASRLALRWMGIPAEPQVLIFDADGRFLGRVDFYWDEFGVVGEADGRSKYVDRDILVAEKLRQENVEDPGTVVTRWGWADVFQSRQAWRRRLDRAFARGSARDRAGLPRCWSARAS